ncbi:MAG: Ig-like domain-containing protein [Candidatus Eisenbacteria bacterium]
MTNGSYWLGTLATILMASSVQASDPTAVPAFFTRDASNWTFEEGSGHPERDPDLPWQVHVLSDQVVSENGLFYSIFEGMGETSSSDEGQRRLSIATSPDGLTNWTQHIDETVIEFEGQRQGDDYGAMSPALGINPDGSLAKYDGEWILLFANYDGIDCEIQWMTSADGIRWTERGSTGLDQGPTGSGDRGEIWPTSLIRDVDGTWYLFYHGGGNQARTIGVATGTNPKSLTPYNGNRAILEPTESWEDGSVHQAQVIKDQTGWLMVYTNTEKEHLGSARSSDLLEWQKEGIFHSEMFKNFGCLTAVDNGDGTVTWRDYGRREYDDGGPGLLFATVPRADDDEPSEFPISDLVVASGETYRVTTMAVGRPVYTDRSYTYTEAPGHFVERTLIQTANDDKRSDASDSDFLSFDLEEAGYVYVIYSPINATLHERWLRPVRGWSSVADFVDTSTPPEEQSGRDVRRKFFDGPGRVELGGNGGSSGSNMYAVLVITLSDNQLPIVDQPQDLFIPRNSKAEWTLGYSDPDGPGPYNVTSSRYPEHGTISIVGGNLEETDGFFRIRYVPDWGFTGSDEFDVKLSDSIEQTLRTFRITIQ